MQGPGQPPQPAQPGQPGQAVFDPDQFKQDILSAVQQELNNFAQNFQPGQPALPPGIPQYGPQPMYGQQVYGQQPLYGQVVNALPPMQAGPGQFQQQQPPPFFQPQQPPPQFFPQQPGQQYGLVPVQPQLPYNPQGQQPTIEQLMQAIMYLLQRQEQMYTQMQQMAQGQYPMLSGGQAVSAAVAPPFPHTGDRVDQYKWLMDFGLTCNYDGTAKAQVTHRDIDSRRRHLNQLEVGLSWSEYWELVGDKYHGVLFEKY